MTRETTRWFGVIVANILWLVSAPYFADIAAAQEGLQRPVILSQRWQENWSVLANQQVPRKPLDALKYIPLSTDNDVYISLGANLRERVEDINAPSFGTAGQKPNTYLLDRLEVHADLRIDGWQAFVQLEDDRAPWKTSVGPADADLFDLEQGFVAHIGAVGSGVLKLRVGRQEFSFDLERFVSDRDGANVRQAYNAVWADYEMRKWRIISFVSQPVQYRDNAAFDDFAGHNLELDGFRVERANFGPGNLAVYYLRYQRDDAYFADASGNETRNAFDVHYSGTQNPIYFDIEAMAQQGSIGRRPLMAWAFGERCGYSFQDLRWTPLLSLQLDAASGNTSRAGTFGTFNPLFPNASYFSLASLTGYANLIHVKPIIRFTPTQTLTLQVAIGLQWRQTTRDAIYTVPANPIAGTAGTGDLWSGAYFQFDIAKKLSPNTTVSAEFVHYEVGSTIRNAGGHNTDYANLQISLGW